MVFTSFSTAYLVLSRWDRNGEPGRNSHLFANTCSSKGSFSCRRTKDSSLQRRHCQLIRIYCTYRDWFIAELIIEKDVSLKARVKYGLFGTSFNGMCLNR